jgi:uncharacterized membrane protein HdeD (DUF308 family)
MDFSLFLAKAWGLYILILSLALLFNRKNLKLVFEAYRHSTTVFFSGVIELVIGILTVLTHNIWATDFRALITLLGWIALIRGILRLFFPKLTQDWAKEYQKSSWLTWLLVLALVIGGYLTLVGFEITSL